MSVLAAAALTVVLLSGCTEQRFARERFESRNERLAYTLGRYGRSEAQRPDRMSYAFGRVGRAIEIDARRTREATPERVVNWVDRDVRRMQERAPLYKQKIGDTLDGRVETLERIAISLFY